MSGYDSEIVRAAVAAINDVENSQDHRDSLLWSLTELIDQMGPEAFAQFVELMGESGERIIKMHELIGQQELNLVQDLIEAAGSRAAELYFQLLDIGYPKNRALNQASLLLDSLRPAITEIIDPRHPDFPKIDIMIILDDAIVKHPRFQTQSAPTDPAE